MLTLQSLAQQVRPVRKVLTAPRARLAPQARRVLKVCPVLLARQDRLARRVRTPQSLDLQVPLVIPVLPGRMRLSLTHCCG